MSPHRKRVRHFHELGDLHELTFSTYRWRPLLTNDLWQQMLSTSINHAAERYQYRLVAFVYIPEHMHLLVCPTTPDPQLAAFLKAAKQPFSFRIKQHLTKKESPLVRRLTVRERPGVTCFRFFCERAVDWKWSSGRRYVFPDSAVDLDLPTIHGLPEEL